MSSKRSWFCGLCVWLVTVGWTWGSEHVLWGVPPDRVEHYQPGGNFKCDEGFLSLPYNKVNDDFCDCADGSDEPSTAACANGVFYCANRGNVPSLIPSSRTNDGSCDCCDGSDEYVSKVCVNDCENIDPAVDWTEEAAIGDFHFENDDVRPYMVHMERRERMEKLDRRDSEKLSVKELVKNQEAAANEAPCLSSECEPDDASIEEKYVEEAFDELDLNKNGILELDEVKSEQIFDFNRDGAIEDREIKWYYDAMPGIANVDYFRTKMWKKIGRLYVLEKEMNKSLTFEFAFTNRKAYPEGTKDNSEKEQVRNAESQKRGKDDLDVREERDEEDPIFVEDSEDELDNDSTDEAVLEANKLRQQLNDAKAKLTDAEKRGEEIMNLLEKEEQRKSKPDYLSEHLDNFGADERYKFFPEKTHCFNYRDKNHVYRLCPFYGTSQNLKFHEGNGYSLGYWAGWTTEDGEPVMMYKGGSVCQNGNQRFTRVNIYCGAQNLLVHVEEPRMCEYRMDFRSPAGCHIKHLNVANVAITSHDEL